MSDSMPVQSDDSPSESGRAAPLGIASLPSALAISRIFPMLVMIAAVVFSFMWRSADFRLQVVDHLGGYDLFNMESALEDPDAEVAVRVCRLLVSNDRLSSTGADSLYRRPDIALACLGRIKVASLEAQRAQRQSRGGSQRRARLDDPTLRRKMRLVSPWQMVATRLARRWMSDVRSAKGDVCSKARHARLALSHADADIDYPMMSCVVVAESESARACCLEELGGEERFAHLRAEAGEISLPSLERDLSALVEASFTPALADKDVDEGADQDADQDPVDDQIRHTPSVQDWVFELGCRVHHDRPRRRQIVQAFQKIIEAEHCAPTEVPWSGFYDMRNWLKICSETYWEHRAVSELSPTAAICESLEDVSIDQSITATRRGLTAALTHARLEARNENLHFGYFIDAQIRQFVPVYPGQWY